MSAPLVGLSTSSPKDPGSGVSDGGLLAGLSAVSPPATRTIPGGSSHEVRVLGSSNGTFGSVAFTWNLANSTVSGGAQNPPYPIGPDRLLVVPSNRTLWVAFATAPVGGAPELVVRNLSTGGMDVVTGIENVTALAGDAALGTVFLTEISGTGSPGSVLAVRASNLDVVRGPIGVGGDPTGLGIDPVTGDVWITVANATTHRGTVRVVAALSESTVTTVPVGDTPTGVAFDAIQQTAWIACSASDNLTILNATTEAIGGRPVALPGSPIPGAIAWDAWSGTIDVVVAPSNGSADRLVVVDPVQDRVLTSTAIPVTGNVTSLGIDPGSGSVLLSVSEGNGTSGAIEEWAPPDGSWRELEPLRSPPTTQSIDPLSRIDYVGAANQVFASAVNLTTPALSTTVDFGAGPLSGSYDAADGRVYVVNSYRPGPGPGSGPDRLAAFAPSGGPATPISPAAPGVDPTGSGLAGVVYDPGTDRLFTAENAWSSGTVLAGASGQWLRNVSLPFAPVAVADDPAHSLVYYASAAGAIAGFHDGNLSSTGLWNSTAPTVSENGTWPGLAVDSLTGAVAALEPDLGPTAISYLRWVSPANGSVRLVALGPAGAANSGDVPDAIAFDPLDGAAYVTATGGTIFVVNESSATVVAQAALGGTPSAVAFDAGRSEVLVAEASNGTVVALDGRTPAGLLGSAIVLGAGPSPRGVVVDPANDQLLVSDYGSGTVDAFSTVPEVAALVPYGTAPALGQGGAPIRIDDAGSPVVFHTVAGGGVPPLSYVYSGLPSGCLSGDVPQLVCRPTTPGATTVVVNVTDALAVEASASAPLEIVPAPTVTLIGTPNRTDGSAVSVQLVANVSGGVAPFTFALVAGDGSPPVVASAARSTLSINHTYGGPGTYSAAVRVLDALGITASGQAAVDVGIPMTGTLTVDGENASNVPVGATVPLRVDVLGGLGPYSFAWRLANGTGPTVVGLAANSSRWNLTVDSAGTLPIRVTVNDSTGATLFLELNLSVSEPRTPTQPVSLAWVGVAAALGILGVAVVLVARRRRRNPPKEP